MGNTVVEFDRGCTHTHLNRPIESKDSPYPLTDSSKNKRFYYPFL